jgi:hypothetical protein
LIVQAINRTRPASHILTDASPKDPVLLESRALPLLVGAGINAFPEAREDFDNNLELVSVWIDYMTAINWMYKNKNTNDGSSNNKWIVTDNGKKWVERILQYNKEI